MSWQDMPWMSYCIGYFLEKNFRRKWEIPSEIHWSKWISSQVNLISPMFVLLDQHTIWSTSKTNYITTTKIILTMIISAMIYNGITFFYSQVRFFYTVFVYQHIWLLLNLCFRSINNGKYKTKQKRSGCIRNNCGWECSICKRLTRSMLARQNAKDHLFFIYSELETLLPLKCYGFVVDSIGTIISTRLISFFTLIIVKCINGMKCMPRYIWPVSWPKEEKELEIINGLVERKRKSITMNIFRTVKWQQPTTKHRSTPFRLHTTILLK